MIKIKLKLSIIWEASRTIINPNRYKILIKKEEQSLMVNKKSQERDKKKYRKFIHAEANKRMRRLFMNPILTQSWGGNETIP